MGAARSGEEAPATVDAGLEAATRFSTWNVSGAKEDKFDDLVAHISASYCWDVLCLQGTCRRTEAPLGI